MPRYIIPASVSTTLAPAKRIAIVVSEYNSSITDKLLAGAIETLGKAGFPDEDILVARVPGAWELPITCQHLISKPTVQGVIALGVVIKGETTHDQHINRAVSQSLMNLSLEQNKPIAFGLLTVNTLEQAIQRSGGNVGNKGEEAANALLALLRLFAAID